MSLHPVTAAVTARIVERSRDSRADYLARMEAAQHDGPGRAKLSCANWAHAFAAESDGVSDAQQMMRRSPAAVPVGLATDVVTCATGEIEPKATGIHHPQQVRAARRRPAR